MRRCSNCLLRGLRRGWDNYERGLKHAKREWPCFSLNRCAVALERRNYSLLADANRARGLVRCRPIGPRRAELSTDAIVTRDSSPDAASTDSRRAAGI